MAFDKLRSILSSRDKAPSASPPGTPEWVQQLSQQRKPPTLGS